MTLDALILELRHELAGELPIRLHARSPAGGRHTKGGAAEPDPEDEPMYRPTEKFYQPGMTGLEFSRQFDRYLSGDHGGDFLASDCFEAIRDWCRIEHWQAGHTSDDPFAWNQCARIAIAAVELRQPLTFIASPEAEDLDVWLVRRLLIDALVFARRWREDRKAGVRISDESRLQLDESEALPVVLAREHDVAHEARVWALWRARFPYLRSWDAELVRRRAFHATHCHGRCALLLIAA